MFLLCYSSTNSICLSDQIRYLNSVLGYAETSQQVMISEVVSVFFSLHTYTYTVYTSWYRYIYKTCYTLVAKTKTPETKLKRDVSSSVNCTLYFQARQHYGKHQIWPLAHHRECHLVWVQFTGQRGREGQGRRLCWQQKQTGCGKTHNKVMYRDKPSQDNLWLAVLP